MPEGKKMHHFAYDCCSQVEQVERDLPSDKWGHRRTHVQLPRLHVDRIMLTVSVLLLAPKLCNNGGVSAKADLARRYRNHSE